MALPHARVLKNAELISKQTKPYIDFEVCWPLNLPRELRGRHLTTTLILPSPASAIVDCQVTHCTPATSLYSPSKMKQSNVVGAHNAIVTSALENNLMQQRLQCNVQIRKYLLKDHCDSIRKTYSVSPSPTVKEAFAMSLVHIIT